MWPKLIFVLGGAASGKSAYAEMLAFEAKRPRIYLATAQPFDAEMKAKIAAHRAQRGTEWTTIECPMDVATALATCTDDQIVLLDCATLWLTNILLADRDITTEADLLLDALATCPAPVIVVSNEVGHGIVPDNALSRQFRGAQGRLNQQLAAAAGRVVMVTAGLPQVLKG